jgi:V/A-type H+-transporting ATPase subunit I
MIPEKLFLTNVLVKKEKANNLLAKLLSTEVFHPVNYTLLSTGNEYVKLWQQEFQSSLWDAITTRFNAITQQLHISISGTHPASYNEARTTLDEIEENLLPLIDEKNQILQEISHLQTMIDKNPVYLPLPANMQYTFIHTETGDIETNKISVFDNLLENIPHVIIPGEIKKDRTIIGVVILKKDIQTLEMVKKEIGWRPLSPEITISDTPVSQYIEKIEQLKKDIAEINKQINKIVEKYKESLAKIAISVEIHQKLFQVKKNALFTETVMVLSGWVPEKEVQKIAEVIRKADPLSFYEFIPAEKSGIPPEEIPVKLNYNKFLKPFQLIVQTYGLPRYGAIDPTLFVAILFLLMFGAMFGDIGHGTVFIILGILLLWRGKAGIKQAGYLMSFAGLSSCFFGFLYGSVFGIEFHPLWNNPMENVSVMFRACIILGIIVLTTGIVLNIINNKINGKKEAVIFDKAGLLSGLIYWAGIGIAATYFTKTGGVLMKIFALLLCTGIFSIFFKFLYDAIRHREEILIGFIEGILHIFEIMMGYLANTISFIRIAAFALDHFCFFITIFAISDMLKKAGMMPFSWLVIILGNILVICLEGLVALIQSLRLNYYEFFSRFFLTGKEIYQPVKLKFYQRIDEYLT